MGVPTSWALRAGSRLEAEMTTLPEVSLLGLAVLMGTVTYGLRVLPFLLPLDRLPAGALDAVRLVGPAALAAVAATAIVLPTLGTGGSSAPDGPGLSAAVTWLACGLCIGIVAITRNLALGVGGALLVAFLAG